MSAELFLEIGTEELPAGFLPAAQADLERLLRKDLEAARITHGDVTTFATPRRLAILVADVAPEQQRQELNLMGPSIKVAFDAEGQPTKAAMGFARSNGVEVDDLTRVETDKGEYVFISKVVEGRPTDEILPEMLPRVIDSIPFKKSMRWKDLDIRFARPMHWIVAIFDGDVVPFTYGNLSSGVLSRGHRFMASDSFTVRDAQSWLQQCEQQFVLPEPHKRKQIIATEIERAARDEGGTVNPDPELLQEVSFLVEYPVALCGRFEEKYLELPRELLITTMREHQRYFTVMDADAELMPRFITIANTRPRDPAVVITGNERVLRARLDDAMFFWQEDRKTPLENRLEALKGVVYQAKLGTSYEKVMRFKQIAVDLAEKFEPEAAPLVERAALLAKCDLETGMVYEFPELQGVMGREYARIEGEDPRVCKAIHEHYLPIHAGGDLPSDSIGAFISIADKIDTICGCFGVGLIPTGTADPYALRRNALGILNIVLDSGLRLSFAELVARSLDLLEPKLQRPKDEVRRDVIEFIRLRFFNMLTGQGFAQDVVDAVLAEAFNDPVNALQRVRALTEMKQRADFDALAVAFKRVVNIIKGGVESEVRPELFEAACEKDLADAVARTANQVQQQVNQGNYAEALQSIAGLRTPVDSFFEGVMVMSEDQAVRNNRLALLTSVARLFQGIADFSRISD